MAVAPVAPPRPQIKSTPRAVELERSTVEGSTAAGGNTVALAVEASTRLPPEQSGARSGAGEPAAAQRGGTGQAPQAQARSGAGAAFC